jgi:enoyl-CoA hydratase/carnithine racemase
MNIPVASSDVALTRHADVLCLTLNRPQAFNALTNAIARGLDETLELVETDRTIRALVITGEGPAFCAGADLKDIAAGGGELDPALVFRRFLERTGVVFDRLERCRVPTIAALNGLTIAGGLELALCCDFIIADAAAKVGDGHAKFAQLPAGGGSTRLHRRVGVARAKYLLFTADYFEASKALEWGLVDEVAPAGQLMAAVDALIAKFVRNSSLVIERVKTLVRDSQEQPLEVALRGEIGMSVLHHGSVDRNEGLAAFVEKRRPAYVGR